MQEAGKMRISVIKCIATIIFFLITFQSFAAADAMQNQPEGKTIAIVVDTSGSMRPLSGSLKSALTGFIEDLGVGWKVTFVTFDVFSDVKGTVTIGSQADRELLKSWVNSLSFNGKDTNFDEALKGAQAGLFQAGVRSNATISIFSDGISDPSDNKRVVDLQAMAKRVFPQDEGYSVYLVGVGEGAAGTGDYSEEDNIVTLRISEDDMRRVLDGIQKNQNLLELLAADQKTAAQPEVAEKTEVEPPKPNPVFEFLRDNWKLLALISGFIALSALGYGIWWAFVQEDPKARDRQNQQIAQPRRAKVSVVGEQNRAYVANTTAGSHINVGNGAQCQLRLDVTDPIAATVSFRNGKAYLERKGRTPVQVDGQMIQKEREIIPGDTFTMGNYTLRYELVSMNSRASDDLQELLGPYARNAGRQV
jgi:hypothetical protein